MAVLRGWRGPLGHSSTALASALLAACGGAQSTLAPAGPAARAAADLWWGMFIVSAVVLLVIVGLWLYALYRAPRTYDSAAQRRLAQRWIIGGGLILPSLTIAILLAFGIPMGHRMLPLPVSGEPLLRIEVIGHQWWWEIRYPDYGVVTANHLVIPAGRAIDLHVGSADVIHSFWVPRLAGKIDMLPGRSNLIRLRADQPGRYRGQCAEFCGAQHARMVLAVDALEADVFDDWRSARQARMKSGHSTGDEHTAAIEAFQPYCGQCHAIAGVSAGTKAPDLPDAGASPALGPGTKAPDLTDLGDRPTLGAGTLARTPGAIHRWLREHQALKPGNAMPAHDDVASETLDAIADWLETLTP